MKIRPILVPAFLSLVAGFASGQSRQPDTGDFNLPAHAEDPAEARKVAEPEEIRVEFNEELQSYVVSGATTEDAVKKVAEVQRLDEAPEGDEVAQKLVQAGGGAQFIATGSGFGMVATGRASYSTEHRNETMVLLEQRQAWMLANLRARLALAEKLGGLSLEAKTTFTRESHRIDDPDGALDNRKQVTNEQIRTSFSRYINGVVSFDVVDDPENGEVHVTVVTTPRTQGRSSSVPGGPVIARSLQDGIGQLFDDILLGVVPPDGGRVITVPDTGEVAWVAFGSEVVGSDRDRDIQRELRDDAVKFARDRAARNLLALIQGERIESSSSAQTTFSKLSKDFERLIDENGDEEIVANSQRVYETVRSRVLREEFGSTVAGKLPGGVQSRDYFSEDGKWAYCIQLWFASAGELAEELSESMRRNSPLGNSQRRMGSYETNPDGSFKTDEKGRLIPRSLGRGRVTRDEDL